MSLAAQDVFTDPDGTLLQNHTPNSGLGSWIVREISDYRPTISSGGYVTKDADVGRADDMICSSDLPTSLEKVTFDVTVLSIVADGSNPHINIGLFESPEQAPQNGLFMSTTARCTGDIRFDFGGLGGTPPPAPFITTYTIGTRIKCKVTVVGLQVKFYVGGVQVSTMTLPSAIGSDRTRILLSGSPAGPCGPSGIRVLRLDNLNVYQTESEPEVPEDPSSLAVTLGTRGWREVGLSWVDNSTTESGFKVEEGAGPSPGTAYVEVVSLGPDVVTHTRLIPVPVPPDVPTEKCYRVRAFSSVGNSGYSNVGCMTPLQAVGGNIISAANPVNLPYNQETGDVPTYTPQTT